MVKSLVDEYNLTNLLDVVWNFVCGDRSFPGPHHACWNLRTCIEMISLKSWSFGGNLSRFYLARKTRTLSKSTGAYNGSYTTTAVLTYIKLCRTTHLVKVPGWCSCRIRLDSPGLYFLGSTSSSEAPSSVCVNYRGGFDAATVESRYNGEDCSPHHRHRQTCLARVKS